MSASTLVLNSDGIPVSMLPLSLISWQDSVKYMVLEKAHVLEWYDDWVIHSVNWSTRVPAVIMLKEYMKKKIIVRFSKQNVFLRDGYHCTYCGVAVTRRNASLDHVVPSSLGGKTTFENSTTSCVKCNSQKGNDHRIKPKKAPFRPSYYFLVEQRKKIDIDLAHPSWSTYLGFNS
jgi:5-methylcytosine-specific restriction endonuclease McrA